MTPSDRLVTAIRAQPTINAIDANDARVVARAALSVLITDAEEKAASYARYGNYAAFGFMKATAQWMRAYLEED